MDRIPFTRQGYENMKSELVRLKTVERPQTLTQLAEAREHGDLSENAEYDAAKERQAFIEGRINDLADKLANADVIEPEALDKDKITFGSRVVLENIDTGEEVSYQLVGPEESDIDHGLISIKSPLGTAILGKKPGDEVVLEAPGGKRSYEILDIL